MELLFVRERIGQTQRHGGLRAMESVRHRLDSEGESGGLYELVEGPRDE